MDPSNDESLHTFKNTNSYFPDMTPYPHRDASFHPRIRRIGWIQLGSNFPTGMVQPKILEKIAAIKASRWPSTFQFNLVRGPISCTLCPHGSRAAFNTELLIPDADNPNSYFGTPAIVDHFIREHGYCPPDAFVRSVTTLDITKPFDAVVAFDEASLPQESVRKIYEIRASSLTYARDTPESARYQRWLETHGYSTKDKKDETTRPSENPDPATGNSPID